MYILYSKCRLAPCIHQYRILLTAPMTDSALCSAEKGRPAASAVSDKPENTNKSQYLNINTMTLSTDMINVHSVFCETEWQQWRHFTKTNSMRPGKELNHEPRATIHCH